MDREHRKLQYKKINEMDDGAEMGEEDDLKVKKTMKKINEFLRYFKTLPDVYYNMNLERLDG